jgi:hypothetical protein
MEDEKLSGRVVIDTILRNMRQQVEELRYSKVVPAAYDVYLHADDQQRFEPLAHEIAAEAVRALQEALDAMNRPSRLDRARDLIWRSRLPYKKVGPWVVRIARDPEGAVPHGRALVISQIALSGDETFEGQRTRRLATLSEQIDRNGTPAAVDPPPPPSAASSAEPNGSAAPAASAQPMPVVLAEASEAASEASEEVTRAPALAQLSWEDDAGRHRYAMTQLEVTIGRAAQGSSVDVRLATLPDVSRLHLRIRYQPEGRTFSIVDLSSLGTTVNGEALTRGEARPLPAPAEIGLAGAITLRFERGILS